MAIIFTDAQIKEATGQALDAPNKVASAEANKAKAIQLKQDFKDLDGTNEVYTNNYKNIIDQYHAEYKYLAGTTKTNPSTSTIDAGGQLAVGNVYFPTGWMNFIPKLNDDVTGIPTSAFVTTESEAMLRAQTYIATMKNGFNLTGTFTQTVSTTTASNFVVTASTGLLAGDPVVVYGPSGYAYGVVSLISGTAPTITVDVTVEHGNLATVGASATAINKDIGFTLANRNSGVAGNRNQYLLGLRTLVDNAILDFETRVTAVNAALLLNDALGAEKTQNDAAKADALATMTDIDTWQAFPITGASRHGDNLPLIEGRMTTRTASNAARTSEIVAGLGSVAQVADGKYTGSGNYHKYFDSLNMRLNLTLGTLRSFYQQDLAIKVSDEEIAMAKAMAARDTSTFIIRELSSDASGSNKVSLKDASSLTLAMAVKIMSNTQPVISATIDAINDLEIQLSASIPATYLTADKARIVKQN